MTHSVSLLLVFLGVLSLARSQCQFSVIEGNTNYYYDLSGLKWNNSNWQFAYNIFWNNTEEWVFNVCDPVSGLPNNFGPYTCASDSIACFQYVGTESDSWISAGKAQNSVFSQSIYGIDKGLGITYSNGDFCSKMNRKVKFEFVCSSSADPSSIPDYPLITNIEHLGCYDILTVNTTFACPMTTIFEIQPQPEPMPEPMPEPYIQNGVPIILILTSVASFLVTLTLCICCICCCVRREMNKNNQNQKAVELTNAFTYQPLPQDSMNTVNPQYYPVQYVPYPGQIPQFAFYQPQVPKPAVETAQIISDEQLAKQLQAELNRQ